MQRFVIWQSAAPIKRPRRPATLALDSLSSSANLNAVIYLMERKQDRSSTLQLINGWKQVGGCLERTPLTSVIKAFVPNPNELENLLHMVLPAGYECQLLSSLLIKQSDEVNALAYDNIDPQKSLHVLLAVDVVGLVESALSIDVVEPIVWHHTAGELQRFYACYCCHSHTTCTPQRPQHGVDFKEASQSFFVMILYELHELMLGVF
ncbi:hypothetical protein BWQ96_04980 [Gracilariopsis chorda]|uniref:Uncharacterized protein n=1 Tax=Gracilariopsis chorda TaxID=448386 RepID=A0A2V3IT37_9FLOR|nr:hypothetical protein BWQ96_04980 [Gracilariopsis chorda]|eukprot:PXF45281.1 hypothetical protein BWQ96_04980 [Gracilariopsis chorda]